MGHVERHVQQDFRLPRNFRTYREIFIHKCIHFLIESSRLNEMIDQTQFECAASVDVIAGEDHPLRPAQTDISREAKRSEARDDAFLDCGKAELAVCSSDPDIRC